MKGVSKFVLVGFASAIVAGLLAPMLGGLLGGQRAA
jgi:hypothetical protein